MVGPGDPAPGFELQGVHGGRIHTYTLDELTDGAALVMGFYVYDFAPICTMQVCDIAEYTWLTLNENVNVVGLSGDGPYSHVKFAEEKQITFPLLCDTDREVCERYGVMYGSKNGFPRVPKRSVFLVTPDQRVAFRWAAADNAEEWDGEPLLRLQDRIRALGFAG